MGKRMVVSFGLFMLFFWPTPQLASTHDPCVKELPASSRWIYCQEEARRERRRQQLIEKERRQKNNIGKNEKSTATKGKADD
jgi:hypothetical protein